MTIFSLSPRHLDTRLEALTLKKVALSASRHAHTTGLQGAERGRLAREGLRSRVQ